MNRKSAIAIAASFIWVGFVCAISFMEAWLKFQAPGITIPLGLGIGRLVFGALNKVEIALALVILLTSLPIKPYKNYVAYFLPVAILLAQTVWMLPALDQRAELHIQGIDLPTSNLHFVYIAVEFCKVVCLLWFGFALLRNRS